MIFKWNNLSVNIKPEVIYLHAVEWFQIMLSKTFYLIAIINQHTVKWFKVLLNQITTFACRLMASSIAINCLYCKLLKSSYLTHRCDPNRYNNSGQRDQEVMAMNVYSIFPKPPELETHHQMALCHIEDIHWEGVVSTFVEMQSAYYTVPAD